LASVTRIACSVSVALALTAGCSNKKPPAAVQSTVAPTVSGRTVAGGTELVIATPGQQRVVTVHRDDTVAAEAPPAEITLIGTLPGVAVIVTDRYASTPGGMSYCQAGEEQFLRVIAIGDTTPLATLNQKVASCRQNIELADPGIEWNAATSTLRVQWLTGPDGATSRTYHVDSKGSVR
jgi:hypothetical protein